MRAEVMRPAHQHGLAQGRNAYNVTGGAIIFSVEGVIAVEKITPSNCVLPQLDVNPANPVKNMDRRRQHARNSCKLGCRAACNHSGLESALRLRTAAGNSVWAGCGKRRKTRAAGEAASQRGQASRRGREIVR